MINKNSVGIKSGNGALKYATTGDDFIDQFGSVSHYREIRTWESISADMRLLYSQCPHKTLALTLYLRLIDRKVKFFDGTITETVQRGQGLKHESIIRAMWLARIVPELFWNNIELIICAGSWKDIFQMLTYDLEHNGWANRKLNWIAFTNLILAGLENPQTTGLVKMYLPSISSNIANKTPRIQARHYIAKHLATTMFGKIKRGDFSPYQKYRELKSSGTANTWQQQISKQLMSQLDFNSIPGRALSKLVSSKFLEKHNLTDRYLTWIDNKPVVKYTGYPFELLAKVKSNHTNKKLSLMETMTINKQFMGLVELASNNVNRKANFITVLDTSLSMTDNAYGLKVSSYDIGKSLALFFSYMLTGPFNNIFYEFGTDATLKVWNGLTPVERIQNDNSENVGSTNLLAVATSFVDFLKSGIELSRFPTGILCLSDGEFDKAGQSDTLTNVEGFKNELLLGGFPSVFVDEFVFVFWDIPNSFYGKKSTAKFETYGDNENVFYMSGYNGSTIGFLMGNQIDSSVKNPKTANDLMGIALNQEIMSRIIV